MTVKELRELVAALPAELDDATVYAYSQIDGGADDVCGVEVYNEKSYKNNMGTPYCGGDAPWDIIKNENGDWVNSGWKGSPAFVIIG